MYPRSLRPVRVSTNAGCRNAVATTSVAPKGIRRECWSSWTAIDPDANARMVASTPSTVLSCSGPLFTGMVIGRSARMGMSLENSPNVYSPVGGVAGDRGCYGDHALQELDAGGRERLPVGIGDVDGDHQDDGNGRAGLEGADLQLLPPGGGLPVHRIERVARLVLAKVRRPGDVGEYADAAPNVSQGADCGYAQLPQAARSADIP